LTYSVYINLLT